MVLKPIFFDVLVVVAITVAVAKTPLSQRHTWRFYTPIAANLITCENRRRFSPHLAIFFADRSVVAVLKRRDKIAQRIRSNDNTKSQERAHLANAGKFNRRYLTCQISAIFCGDRRHTWRFSSIAAIGV